MSSNKMKQQQQPQQQQQQQQAAEQRRLGSRRQLVIRNSLGPISALVVALNLLLIGPALVSSLAPAGSSSNSSSTSSATATATASPKSTPAAATSATSILQLAKPKLETIKVNFTDCGSKNIKEVRITPCPGDGTVCHINLGTNVTVEADFVAKHEASSLNEVIKGVIRGRELQFPEQRADPCKSTISPHCPIKVGKHYQYRAMFEVKPHYPAIPVKVRYALANAAGDIVACVQISAKIVDPSPVRPTRAKPKKKTA